MKSMFPSHILLLLYSTLVLPYINYGILACGNSSKSQLDRLSITQKRVMRIIENKPRLTPSNNLFFDNKVLKLNDLFYYQLGCLMYQARVHEIPQVLQSMFRQNDRVHNHSTRQSSSFHLPLLHVRTRLAQNTLIYSGPFY